MNTVDLNTSPQAITPCVVSEATLLKLLEEHDIGDVRALIQTMQGRDEEPHFPEPPPEPMNWPCAFVRVVDLVCDLLFWGAVIAGGYLLLTR